MLSLCAFLQRLIANAGENRMKLQAAGSMECMYITIYEYMYISMHVCIYVCARIAFTSAAHAQFTFLQPKFVLEMPACAYICTQYIYMRVIKNMPATFPPRYKEGENVCFS